MGMEYTFRTPARLVATLEDARQWRGELSPDNTKHPETIRALGVVAREAASPEEQEVSNTDDA